MSVAALRGSLAALREAQAKLVRRPRASRLAALGELLEHFRDEASPARRRLAEELPAATGFTRPVVERGLALALEPWTAQALRRSAERELGDAAPLATTSVLLAGAIPQPTLLALVAPLAAGSAVLARPASRDPLTARVVTDTLAGLDPELATALALAHFDHADDEALRAFLEADCVVLTGSDATVETLAAHVRAPRRVLRHGHRLSVAAFVSGAGGEALARAADALALDVALWDQLGCLSPVALYTTGSPEEAGAALAEALERVERELPRGALAAEAAVAIAHERDEAELRVAGGVAAALHHGAGWTVVVERDARPRPAPLHRFVRVHPIADGAALIDGLRPLAPHLAAVGVDHAPPELERALRKLGASLVVPVGIMQAPPLDWPRDGSPVFSPYLR